MAKKGQTIENKITGEVVTFIETAADSNGKRLRFRLKVKPKGYVVVNHIHPSQDEKFDMKEGQLKVLYGKETKYLKPSDTLMIEKGQPHQWWNESETDEVAVDVEFTPAGKMEVFLEQFYGLCNDGKCDAKGNPSFMQLMAFSTEYELYVSGPPIGIQKIMSAVLGSIARLIGYKKYYPKYSEQ